MCSISSPVSWQFCCYCGIAVQKMGRHLTMKHPNENDVAKALSFLKNPSCSKTMTSHPRRSSTPVPGSSGPSADVPKHIGDTAVTCHTPLCGLMCQCSMPWSTATAARSATNAAGRGTSWGQPQLQLLCQVPWSSCLSEWTGLDLRKWVHYAVFLNGVWQWPVCLPQEKQWFYIFTDAKRVIFLIVILVAADILCVV